jgi:hypothetical protein
VVEDEAEVAARRQKQQAFQNEELKKKMTAEASNSRINGFKITNQWRKVMRLAKAESLKKEIEILSQNHERDVDRKDAILQMLDRDLEEAEDQFQMALRTHLVNIDGLIQLHDNRLYTLERSFQAELKNLQTVFLSEKDAISFKFAREKRDLKSIIGAIEKEEQEREGEAKHAFEQLREEIRNRNLEDVNMLRINLDAQIEELEQHFETAHLNYLQQTAVRTHDFKSLTQNDHSLSQKIEVSRKKIDNLQTTIQQWRAKIKQLGRETEDRNRLLLDEKHSIQTHYQQLKQRIHTYRGTQNLRLLQLSQCANKCKSALKDKLELARRVLHVAELSRKIETMQEKVLPFENKAAEEDAKPLVAPSGGDEAADGLKAVKKEIDTEAPPPAHQSSVWNPAGEFIQPTDRLAHFHRMYNRVILDGIAVDKEKERLVEENAQLEDLIDQYVQGLQLNGRVLDEDNPLFVVNGRANLNHVPPVRKMDATVVQDATEICLTASRQYSTNAYY